MDASFIMHYESTEEDQLLRDQPLTPLSLHCYCTATVPWRTCGRGQSLTLLRLSLPCCLAYVQHPLGEGNCRFASSPCTQARFPSLPPRCPFEGAFLLLSPTCCCARVQDPLREAKREAQESVAKLEALQV